jgi:hypothetical protein
MVLIKTKNQVFEKFKIFKRMVETIIGQKLKILWSDHGGEYSFVEFQ